LLIDQEPMGNQEPSMSFPGIAIDHSEDQAEARFEFILPLGEYGRWASHNDIADLFAKQEFAGDKAGLDGLSQPHIVGDEQVHPWHQERFAEGFDLVMIDPDSSAEWCLE
jgi:hypothetical protein